MAPAFDARRDGSIHVRLDAEEAQVIRRVAAELADAVTEAGDPSFRRLFPVAYQDDDRLQEEFARMTHDDLVAGKVAAARAVVASIDEGGRRRGGFTTILDEEAAGCWLRVLNDARLVLGTRLDIRDDEEHVPLPAHDPRAPTMNLYLYLSGLEELLVDALAQRLPGPIEDDDPI